MSAPCLQIADVRGGEQHTLALTKDGRVLTFGAATYGMLGRSGLDVAKASENYPDPSAVDGLEGLKVRTSPIPRRRMVLRASR